MYTCVKVKLSLLHNPVLHRVCNNYEISDYHMQYVVRKISLKIIVRSERTIKTVNNEYSIQFHFTPTNIR